MEATRARTTTVHDTLNFFGVWIARPLSMGAFAPSSPSLAAAVAREVDFSRPGVVVELGGGTGSITRALVDRTPDPSRIIVIENVNSFCDVLSQRFPDVRVIRGDARNLRGLLADAGVSEVNTIISGIPLLSIPGDARDAIVTESVKALPPDGTFIQFTYSLASPVPASTAALAGITGHRACRVYRNLPPAAVWRYYRDPTKARH